MTTTYFRDLLDREAPALDLGRVSVPMERYALDLAHAYPRATAEALACKLLTIWPGSGRELRLLVAHAALEAVAAGDAIAA